MNILSAFMFFLLSIHSVTLSWDHPVDSTPANPGFVRVYRCLGSQPVGCTLLADNVPPDGPYVDNTITIASYYYYVTIVINGIESAPSNKPHAVITPFTILNVKSVGQ